MSNIMRFIPHGQLCLWHYPSSWTTVSLADVNKDGKNGAFNWLQSRDLKVDLAVDPRFQEWLQIAVMDEKVRDQADGTKGPDQDPKCYA
jgi:hypothetical protein